MSQYKCRNIFKHSTFFILFCCLWFSQTNASQSNSNTRLAPVEPLTVDLISNDTEKRVKAPHDSIDIAWKSSLEFDDSEWETVAEAPGGVGFDREGDYAKYISLDTKPLMGGRTSCYIRIPFEIAAPVLNELDFLALKIRYDDGFIAYLNGERVAASNAPPVAKWYSGATQPHEAHSILTFDISEHLTELKPGQNLLAIHGLNVSRSSPDFLIQATLQGRKNYQRNFASTLPIFVIRTQTNKSITSSPATANLGVIQTENKLNTLADPNNFSGSITIQEDNTFDYPKSDFHFQITNKQGQPQDAGLLNLPHGDAWRLHAPYSDKSLMRTALACELARRMGAPASRTRFCHLFVNDDYFGIYLLMEQRNRHENRIDMSPLPPNASSGDALTGGYILSVGQRGLPGFTSSHLPFKNAPFLIGYHYMYPDAETISPAQQQYIEKFINRFETSLLNNEALSEYEQYLDVSACINYFLINEMAKNIHAYRSSTLLYKDRNSIDSTLQIEPVWDFRHALNNIDSHNGWTVDGWQLDYLLNNPTAKSDTLLVPFWWRRLYQNGELRQHIYEHWTDLRTNALAEDAVYKLADSLYYHLESDLVLNFERWNVLDKTIWPNHHTGESYDDEYFNMLLWLIDRMDWMDAAMSSWQFAAVHESKKPENFTLKDNVPNPFNPSTLIRCTLAEPAHVSCTIYNQLGQAVKHMNFGLQYAGEHSFVWHGVDIHGRNAPSGMYFYSVRVGKASQVRTMLLLR